MLPDNARASLPKYINSGCFSKRDYCLSVISPKLLFALKAREMSRILATNQSEEDRDQGASMSIQIDPYAGANPFVLRMKDYLKEHLHDDLLGAYAHGSLGTYEEQAYSDFDALVILKKEVYSIPRRLTETAIKLHRALRIMFEYDPFQHHGWFVLTEDDLSHYPQIYFPLELFAEAKSLLSSRGQSLTVRMDPTPPDYLPPFFSLSRSLFRKLGRRGRPGNLYHLKGLLSQFMLLPTLYHQAKYRKAIFKKFSFSAVRPDFNAKDWAIMDEVSAIRAVWPAVPPGAWRSLAAKPSPTSRYLAKQFAPKIPSDLAQKLDSDFYSRVLSLARMMVENITSSEARFESP